jgi:hypothetical protein
MSVPADTKYPKNLTNTYWQSKKSFKDKTRKATKTGLGALLTAAEKAYGKIPVKALDTSKHAPKSVKEAKVLLAAAKKAKTTEVKAASDAVEKARVMAVKTSKNMALSDTARQAATSIASGLSHLRLNTLIADFGYKDFEVLVAKAEAAEKGGEALQQVHIHLPHGGTSVASTAKAIRKGNLVSAANLLWTGDAGDPKKLLNKLVTVKAKHPDNSLFVNDMKITSLSSDNKTIKLKSP